MEEKLGAVSWKIEKIVSKGDYDYAVVKGHPKATKYGYVLHHRIVMENHLGRLLNKNEIVHHKNHNRKDNRIDNLEVMDATEHAKLHRSETPRKVCELACPWCKEHFFRWKNQTFLQKGSEYTCCSRSCSGKLARYIQLNGRTANVETAISGNLVREFYSTENPEQTA